jgi:tRNA1(Val) A37 N6-methylase TrmN6
LKPSQNVTSFKGWAKPGPLIRSEIVVPEDQTLDAISGDYRLFQLKKGHRFSTDDLLVAWYGTSWCPRAATVLDLGSGIGSVGMIAAWRLPGATFVTIEAQAESVKLATASASYNQLGERYQIRQGDFRDSAVLAPGELFDLILGSPPYFPVGSGIEGDHPQKIACRFEVRGNISDYCRVALAHLAAGGVFAAVFPLPDGQHQRIIDAAANAGLAIVRQRPVILREGEPPLLAVFIMMRKEDLPEWFRGETWLEPPLIIRRKEGAVHPEYSAVKLSIGFPP